MSDPKASGLCLPSKLGRPCCTVQPKPAVPSSNPRSTMNTSVILTEDTDSFIIGNRVWVGGTKPGSIAYIGETQFAPGDWAGVVLDEPIGKNDGSVAGSRYFQCALKHGIFSRLTRLTAHPLFDATTPMSPSEKTLLSNNSKSMSPLLIASTSSLSSSISQIHDLKMSDRVIVSSSHGSKTGILRFIGTTEFAAGDWCGVELDEPAGKNDGFVAGIRYFECQPKHGLFAPLHKVSRSPSSKRSSSRLIHKPSGAAFNLSLRKIGSRDSLISVPSMTSAISSSSIQRAPTSQRSRQSTPVQSSLQETLKEKQQEIEMLRKERDLERDRSIKAATQADDAEQSILTLRREYDKYREDIEKTVLDAQSALAQLLEEKSMLSSQLEKEKNKCEDLLFRLEEESICKEDIQVINTINENKIRDLQNKLSKERERVIQLENDDTKLFEVEEVLAELHSEKRNLSKLENTSLKIKKKITCLKEAKITLENQMLERNHKVQELKNKLKQLEAEYFKAQESSVQLKNNFPNEKEIIQILSAMMEEGIDDLKTTIASLQIENVEKNEVDITEFKMTIQKKDDGIKAKVKVLDSEKLNLLDSREQVEIKNEEIKELSKHMEKQILEIAKLKSPITVSFGTEKVHVDNREIIKNLETHLRISKVDNSEPKEKLEMTKLERKVDEKNTILSGNSKLRRSIENFESINNNLKTEEMKFGKINAAKDVEIEAMKESFHLRLDDELKKIDQIRNKISKKSLRLNLVEQELADMKSQLAQKDGEIENLLEKMTELKNAITFSGQRKSDLEKKLKIHENNIKDLSENLTFSEDKTEQLNSEKIKLKAEISSVILSSTDSSKQLIEYNEDLRSKDREISALRDQKFELDALIKDTNGKLNEKEEEIVSCRKLIDILKSENTSIRGNSGIIVRKNSEQELKIQNDFLELERESNKMSKSYEDQIFKLDEKIKSMHELYIVVNLQQKSGNSEKSRNSNELDIFERLYEESQMMNEKLSETISSLETSVSDLMSKLKKSANQLQSYEKNKNNMKFSDSDKTVMIKQLQENRIGIEVKVDEKIISHENETKLLVNTVGGGQEETEKLMNTIASMEMTIGNLESQLDEAKKKIEFYKHECQNLDTSDPEKCVNVEVLIEKQSEVEQLSGSLRLIESENVVPNNEMQSKSELIEDLGNLVAQLKENNSLHLESIQNLTEQLGTERTERDELNDDRVRAETEINFIKAQNHELKALKLILEETVRNAGEKIMKYMIRTENIDHQTAELRENHPKLKKENRQTKKNLQWARSELEQKTKSKNIDHKMATVQNDNQVDIIRIHENDEIYKSQIDFLNSVIIEMQKKNEKLHCKVEVLEMGVPATEADDYSKSMVDKKASATRMFCDICDQFDLHETEDCPKQSQGSEIDKPIKSSPKNPDDRPYCENCEMFGHDTADCADAETF